MVVEVDLFQLNVGVDLQVNKALELLADPATSTPAEPLQLTFSNESVTPQTPLGSKAGAL